VKRHSLFESLRAWIWGLGIPLAIVVLVAAGSWWYLLLLAVYPLQVARLARRSKQTKRENWWRGGALVLGKFPEMIGQIKFLVDGIRGAQPRLIEYK
jgi:hypothetical protein